MIHLVTGGSGSGKSEYAERLAVESGCISRIYLATMMVWDEEGKRRVGRHRGMREGKGFTTLEQFYDLERVKLVKSGGGKSAVLLECMSNLASNEFYRKKSGAADRILRGVLNLSCQCEELIIVTNEVFSDGIRYGEETEAYLELLGEINCRLGKMADTVTEVVFGCPVKIK